MKKILLLLIVLVISKFTQAQDLLITTTGDSINCKIVDEKGTFILYKTFEGNSFLSRAINKQSVSKTEINFYLKNPELVKTNVNSISKTESYTTTNLNVGFNKSELIDIFKPSGIEIYDNYNKKLSNGFVFNLELQQWLSKRIGFSFRYDYFKSEVTETKMPVTINGVTQYISVTDEINIHTISPGLTLRTPIVNENNYLIINGAFDYNFYVNSLNYGGTSGKIKSKRYGYSFGMSYERILNKNLSIGLNAKYRISSLNKMEVYVNGDFDEVELDESQEISINRYSVGVYLGIR